MMTEQSATFLSLIILLAIAVFHETGHMFVFSLLGYKCRLELRKKWGIPWVLAVVIEGMENKRFSELTERQQLHYSVSALAPYVFIIPYSVFLIELPTQYIAFWSVGLIILIWHILNVIGEFVVT